jgi:hypothetical protein
MNVIPTLEFTACNPSITWERLILEKRGRDVTDFGMLCFSSFCSIPNNTTIGISFVISFSICFSCIVFPDPSTIVHKAKF